MSGPNPNSETLNCLRSPVFPLISDGHVALVREFLWVMSRCASLSYLLRHVARVTCPIVVRSASVDLLKTLSCICVNTNNRFFAQRRPFVDEDAL